MKEAEGPRRASVLVIDDEPAVAGVLSATLSAEFSVSTATDALDGYALICQHKPDVVLLDVMMPFVDGWTVLRKIRSNPALVDLIVIVVTGLDREAAEHESNRLGVRHILLKPVAPRQLIEAVRTALAR